ncbi:MAG: TonB-dependent receptor [Luteolibacter sp.]
MRPAKRPLAVALAALLGLGNVTWADEADDADIELAPLTVTALRGQSLLEGSTFAISSFVADDFNRSPHWTADDFLRQVPGFSLFRRTSSLVANPTIQGASLRGIGPSATSRSLVLFDGVPLNDAFGGWVNWSQINLRHADRIEVVRGGGSAAWGNTALGGVIQIVPRLAEPRTMETQLMLGNQGTWESSIYTSERVGGFGIALEARAFATDGYKRVRKDQRGVVDIRSDARHEVFHLVADYEFPSAARLSVRGTYFDEVRGNGTSLTGNTTENHRLHLKLESDPEADFTWRADGYAGQTEFTSTFSSVSADRNSEALVLDQYSVPSHTFGGGWQGTWRLPDLGAITLGTDWVGIQGRTNERVIFAGDDRIAGGRQLLGGIHAGHDWEPAERWRWQAGLRIDYWRSYNGSIKPPNASRAEFTPRDGTVINGRAGLSREITDALTVRSSVYQAFRAPTLNELYRPFQVGADVTQANPMLDPERLLGAEIGFDYLPTPAFEFRNTVFFNQVKDPILNVTIGTTAGGGQLREKRNIEETRIAGMESEMVWRPADPVSIFLRHALTDARVHRADDQPALVGKRLAQVPRHAITLGTSRQWGGGPEITVQVRWTDTQYEDDLNQRMLDSYPLIDLSIQHPLGERGTLFAGVENLLDRRYADGITGNGLTTEGRPRSYQAGIRFRF